MRSHGHVRFITITSKMQIGAATLLLVLSLAWAVSMAVMALGQYQSSSERADLLTREAEVATAESRLDTYRGDITAVTADLEQRQDFIEGLMDTLPADIFAPPTAGDTVSDSTDEAAETINKVSQAIPEAAGLARIEARQLAFVEGLTRYADLRATKAEAAIRKLGLSSALLLESSRSAQGGPLEKLISESDGSLDPRFERLSLSLARMDALEMGLRHIPQFMPADISMISSNFGYRRDPLNGSGAMHSGLDFRGPTGAPIHAAADGTVSFVGNKSGYGKTVEITHGNGMLTRYAHMSRWKATQGAQVSAGDIIGAIGSTGRSTGPHLHFEVRINNRAVNPRPFLETAPNVLKEARAEFTEPSNPHAHNGE